MCLDLVLAVILASDYFFFLLPILTDLKYVFSNRRNGEPSNLKTFHAQVKKYSIYAARERHRQINTERQRASERERERQRQRQTERDTERDRETEIQTERPRQKVSYQNRLK